ncbi:NAD-dependent epimerase/dehydratase family protein [Candidatus Omnitrophota bacterium]
MKKRIYLVTGASGFIGSCLTRRLTRMKGEVHVILRKTSKLWRIKDIISKVKVHECDLSHSAKLNKAIARIKPQIIYHLAAYGAYPYQVEPDKIINTNILGTWNLLKATSQLDYKLFVNTGSSSEYGFKKKPMRETDLLEPASYYAVTKCSQTLLCSYFARLQKKPIATLRPFSVYGPYEQPGRFMPVLMRSLYFKEKMDLVSAQTAHDHIYIDDVIDAFLLVEKLKRYPGEIFNIGTGRQSSIKDVVDTLVKITSKSTDFKWGSMKPRLWDTMHWVADTSKTKSLLGWKAKVGLKEGLSLTWEWFKDHYRFYVR